jgi:hypothetical protein
MTGGCVVGIAVALGALLDDGDLDVLLVVLFDGVDVPMAITAAEVFLEVVEILQVFLRDILVADAAIHRGRLLLPVAVFFNVRDVRVAACTAVVGVDRFLEVNPVQRLIVTELAILLSGGTADDRLADKGNNGKEEQPDHRKDALPGCTSFHLP